ncbi:hypothetical protein QQF64_034836 [Cirrhinus molitorella]|uniref:Uncharacterized protein n=1 Tax=Cirrhinus molitorella TaxID=172907 RepID=A0ABR3L310_9TELE
MSLDGIQEFTWNLTVLTKVSSSALQRRLWVFLTQEKGTNRRKGTVMKPALSSKRSQLQRVSSPHANVSGWPSGLRRCVQVAVSPGGVGSNPTSDRLSFGFGQQLPSSALGRTCGSYIRIELGLGQHYAEFLTKCHAVHPPVELWSFDSGERDKQGEGEKEAALRLRSQPSPGGVGSNPTSDRLMFGCIERYGLQPSGTLAQRGINFPKTLLFSGMSEQYKRGSISGGRSIKLESNTPYRFVRRHSHPDTTLGHF